MSSVAINRTADGYTATFDNVVYALDERSFPRTRGTALRVVFRDRRNHTAGRRSVGTIWRDKNGGLRLDPATPNAGWHAGQPNARTKKNADVLRAIAAAWFQGAVVL